MSDVELRLPAESAYVAVLRMTTAGLAARLDFTLDDIEDLRVAVGEACALVLEASGESEELRADFKLGTSAGANAADTLRVTVSTTVADDVEPATDTFSWQVLRSLADDVEIGRGDGRLAISFTVASTVNG